MDQKDNIPTQAGELSGEPSAKKPRKKRIGIAAGVLAAAIVVAGAGFWVWHEQPSFCGAICHTPMDPYLATYEAEPGEATVDKWGNGVEDAGSMIAASHRANSSEATCLSCHEPTLSQQISEGIAWVTGGYDAVENAVYEKVIYERNLKELTAHSDEPSEALCLNSACHVNDDGSVMTQDDLIEITDSMELNPHDSMHGTVACTDCHKAHRASVMYCSGCHSEAEIPEGWLSASQEKQLAQTAI